MPLFSQFPDSNSAFLSLKLTRPPRVLLRFGLVLFLLVVVIVAALVYVPWRQTVIGQGEVAVYSPLDRPQNVESQIKGQVVELLVNEGDIVEAGQVLAKLTERDTKFLDPRQIERTKARVEALREKQRAAERRISALHSQSRAIGLAQTAKMDSVSGKVRQIEQKLDIQRQQLRLGEQDVLTAKLQRDRIETLFKKGLKSRRKLELAIQKLVQAETKLQKMKGDLVLSQRDLDLQSLSRPNIRATASEKQSKIAESIAKTQESISEVEEKIEKLNNEMGTLKVRTSLRTIVAPRSGRIVTLNKLGPGHFLKEGDVIARISPEDQDPGVELYLSGLDIPLVQPGLKVRLMFEGFPAVPFAGWPWASVGTFGGVVTYVDPVNTEAKGKDGYRIWVKPDPSEESWPPQEKLRLGSRATGWIMLNNVPLYYELWRQLNAFPSQPAKDASGKKKKPKTKPVIRR